MRTGHYLLRLSLISALIVCALSANADIDKKYFKKTAAQVWASEMPGFDPRAELTDTIFDGQNACFIARYVGLTADYNNDANQNKISQFGIDQMNQTNARFIRRYMVKINNEAGAEDFTEFTVSPDVSRKIRGHEFGKERKAFGARIIKPDGTVKEVDIDDALAVKKGKKNKEIVEYKIAIPDLQPGDVLDYFYQTEYSFDELNIPEFQAVFLAKYPTRLYTLDIRVDPRLNMEYGSYNGAPRVSEFSRTADGKNLLFLQLDNIDFFDEAIPYFSAARQVPMMEFYILNPNNPRLEYMPKMSRPGGMRLAHSAFVIRDIGFAIVDTEVNDKLVNEAVSIVKNWKKTHADATSRQIADFAWIALRYATIKAGEILSDRRYSKTFCRIMEKLDSGTPARIAVTNTRKNIAISQIPNHNDARYFVIIGDQFYYPSNNETVLPGELPGYIDNEDYIVFDDRPDTPDLYTKVAYGKFPASKPKDNSAKIITTVGLDADEPDAVEVASTMTFTGVVKSVASFALTHDQSVESMQKYLEVKPQKIKSSKDAEEEADEVKENMEEFISRWWNTKDAHLRKYELASTGTVPDMAETVIKADGVVPGVVSRAGNNLMVNIGKFIGEQTQFTGDKRRREVSTLFDAAHTTDVTIYFEIPDGYEIVPESLDDLNTSSTIAGATFNAGAEVEGNKVKIRVVERYARSVYPATVWPELLKVLDAAYAYNAATIMLRPTR
ncbi:MAG: DUF3857 domain-containing protein [Paramuribaculum sp.]|nr:DUF3857 domain-containing protein [Paramuribaculum sp.]